MKELFSDVVQSGRRVIVLVLVIGLAIGSVGVVAGLSIGQLPEKIEVWNSQSQDTDFNIASYDADIKREDRIDVTTEIKNQDTSSAHEGNVTVRLLDSNGDILIEKTKPTESVSSDSTVKLDYQFTQSNLADNYDRTFIEVDQTS
jgi:hypothetical protein